MTSNGNGMLLLLVVQGQELHVMAVTRGGTPESGAFTGRPLATAFPGLATDAVLSGLRRVLATGQPLQDPVGHAICVDL